jgi:hypothetical protein
MRDFSFSPAGREHSPAGGDHSEGRALFVPAVGGDHSEGWALFVPSPHRGEGQGEGRATHADSLGTLTPALSLEARGGSEGSEAGTRRDPHPCPPPKGERGWALHDPSPFGGDGGVVR